MKKACLTFVLTWIALAAAMAQVAPNCVTLTCPATLTVPCAGTNGTVVDFEVPARTTCGRLVTTVCQPPSGSVFRTGLTTVTCVATDDLRNSASCEFAVSVQDAAPPSLITPPAITAPCTGPAGALVAYSVSVTDDCDPQPRLYCVPPSGSVFPLGTTTVTCVAVDASAHESSTSFPVTVSGACDDSCLSLFCPGELDLVVGRGDEVLVEYPVRATNFCSGLDIPVVCLPPSGSSFGVGSTPVRCTAQDSGITKECRFAVTVRDNVAPKLITPRVVQTECDGIYGLAHDAGALVSFAVSAKDNVDPQPSVQCTPPSGSFFPLGTNQVVCQAQDASGNRATAQFNVVVESGPACEYTAVVGGGIAPEPDNWGFELGLVSWQGQGNAFATNQQPVLGDRIATKRIAAVKAHIESEIGGGYWQDVPYPIGFKGRRWIGTAEAQVFGFGVVDEALTGTLRSKRFTIAHRNLNFLIGGGVDLPHLKVELLIETGGPGPGSELIGTGYYSVMEQATGPGQEIMHRAGWDVSSYLGKKAYLRLVDASATGHLNVDDFRFDDVPPQEQTVRIGDQTYPAVVLIDGLAYDWDSPVWGLADLHTHPMSYLGFGGKLMHGAANAGLAGLSDCNTNHGGYGPDNTSGDYWRQLIQMVMDDKGNDPHREGWMPHEAGNNYQWKQFRHWPVFTTVGHQQMWHEWIRRAYDGGLRVMVALCVNNPLLARASKGDLPDDDKAVSDLQIAELKSFAVNNSSFMEIAYDPYQLRDIVRRGKLAVIIGTELDDIGNFDGNPIVGTTDPDQFARQLVRNEIGRLYTNGVRYMFPVHLMNNKFGGTAIGSDMLNLATKYLTGQPFTVKLAASDDLINYHLTDFNTITIDGVNFDTGWLAAAGALAAPLIPALLPLIGTVTDATGKTAPGSGTAFSASLAPIATVGMIGALPVLVSAIATGPIPLDIAPLPGVYPSYPGTNAAPHGIRNAMGLTDLGRFAIREMMRLGIMIDVDHMSQETINEVFRMAETNGVGYPLNSGHNSFRDLGIEVNENHRTAGQLERIRALGGLMGVGWENGPARDLATAVPSPVYSRSDIDNDCAGTSKTFAQLYLYALEKMHGSHVAFGTDIDGLIVGPGPRFGAQGAFGLPDDDDPNRRDGDHTKKDRAYDIGKQKEGVLYSPRHGKPLTTGAFVGDAVDPDREFQGARYGKGYRYNKDQRDFYAAIRIFFWYHSGGATIPANADALNHQLEAIQDGLNGIYNDPRRVKEYAFGMIKALKGWAPGSDVLDTDAETQQQLGIAVVRHEVFGEDMPDFIDTADKQSRYSRHLSVWKDYQRIFGDNPPMKRCATDQKEWDINFEGIAHYGLLPDFLQDLTNVGLETEDLSVVFQSAEHFAQMWHKTLRAADAIKHPSLLARVDSVAGASTLHLEWNADESDQLEESDAPGDRASWRPSTAEARFVDNHMEATVTFRPGTAPRFYRVRKQ